MKKLQALIFGIVCLSLMAAYYLSQDEALSPESQAMLERVTQHTESKAYEYLNGISAPLGKDPKVLGRQRVRDYKNALQKNANPYEVEFPRVDNRLKLERLGGGDSDKISLLFEYAQLEKALSKEQSELLKRYHYLLTLDDQHVTFVSIMMPFSDYIYVIEANNLVSVNAIRLAQKGDLRGAEKLLHKNIIQLRLQLEKADMLVHKLIYNSMISKSINVLSVLNKKYQNAFHIPFKPLSIEERSFEKPLAFEFAFKNDAAQSALHNSENNNGSNEFSYPKWAMPLFYKPNMTMNTVYPLLKESIEDSLLTNQEFARKTSQAKQLKSTLSVRNYIGNKLLEISGVNFETYIARVFALDAKIALYNESLKRSHNDDDLSQIKNPFYDSKSAYFANDKTLLCIDAPLLKEDQYQDRCLRLKL